MLYLNVSMGFYLKTIKFKYIIVINLLGELKMAIGLTEIIIVLVIILILFGPKKLPQLARAIGKSVRQYREGLQEKNKKKELKG